MSLVAAALWIFGLILLLRVVMSVNSIFNGHLVASSADGVEERTIVLAIERNTKHLEPMIHEINESS